MLRQTTKSTNKRRKYENLLRVGFIKYAGVVRDVYWDDSLYGVSSYMQDAQVKLVSSNWSIEHVQVILHPKIQINNYAT